MDSLNKRRFHPLVVFLVISIIMACDLPALTPAPLPTSVPGSIDTVIAQTASAASAQTAEASAHPPQVSSPTVTSGSPNIAPTITPSPTYISALSPSNTPTITPTFVFILLTFTPTERPGDTYACQITGQTPDNGTAIVSGLDFQASWTVKNTGRANWDPNSIDFIYSGGDKLTRTKAIDFPSFVAPGASTLVGMVMTAPNSPGPHKTVWALRVGKNEFCTLSLTILVK